MAEKLIRGPEWAALPIITVTSFGSSILWSTEMAFASPYLLSLGLSKSMMTLVFLSGPLAGLIVQPIVGSIADRSTSTFGRRRPFMLGGCLATSLSLLLLGFTRNVADIVVPHSSQSNDSLTRFLAVLAIYLINFCYNVVITSDSTIIIDVLPVEQQESARAWASRMSAIGSVCGFYVGQVDLPRYFPLLGSTQLQVVSVLATFVFLLTHGVTLTCVKEVPLEAVSEPAESRWFRVRRSLDSLITMPSAFLALPEQIRRLCWIQFLVWIGVFPFAFFSTTWIGELYQKDYSGSTDPDEGTRYGTKALFWGGVVTLFLILTLPKLVAPRNTMDGTPHSGHRVSIWSWIRRTLTTRPDLVSLYALSQLWFGLLISFTWIYSGVDAVVVIFALMGFSNAMGGWAPHTLLGEMVKADALTAEYIPLPVQAGPIESTSESTVKKTDDDDSLGIVVPHNDEPTSAVNEHAGAIVGIMNTFIVLPQFLMIAVSSILFTLLDPGRSAIGGAVSDPAQGEAGLDTVGLIFRIGGIASFFAFYLTIQLDSNR